MTTAVPNGDAAGRSGGANAGPRAGAIDDAAPPRRPARTVHDAADHAEAAATADPPVAPGADRSADVVEHADPNPPARLPPSPYDRAQADPPGEAAPDPPGAPDQSGDTAEHVGVERDAHPESGVAGRPEDEAAAGPLNRDGVSPDGAATATEPVAKKVYYSIGEVGELTGLKPHVLRYWESQFNVVSPGKNRGGSRVYRVEDIRTILLVKRLLYEERFTIEGAKQKLHEMRRDRKFEAETQLRAEPAMLALIKDGLVAARAALTLPPDQATRRPD